MNNSARDFPRGHCRCISNFSLTPFDRLYLRSWVFCCSARLGSIQKGYPDILPRWETMNLARENTASLTDQNSFTGRDDL